MFPRHGKRIVQSIGKKNLVKPYITPPKGSRTATEVHAPGSDKSLIKHFFDLVRVFFKTFGPLIKCCRIVEAQVLDIDRDKAFIAHGSNYVIQGW